MLQCIAEIADGKIVDASYDLQSHSAPAYDATWFRANASGICHLAGDPDLPTRPASSWGLNGTATSTCTAWTSRSAWRWRFWSASPSAC